MGRHAASLRSSCRRTTWCSRWVPWPSLMHLTSPMLACRLGNLGMPTAVDPGDITQSAARPLNPDDTFVAAGGRPAGGRERRVQADRPRPHPPGPHRGVSWGAAFADVEEGHGTGGASFSQSPARIQLPARRLRQPRPALHHSRYP